MTLQSRSPFVYLSLRGKKLLAIRNQNPFLLFDIPVFCLALLFLQSASALADGVAEDRCNTRLFGRADWNDFGKSLAQSPLDGAIYYGSRADVEGRGVEAALTEINADGNILWTKYYGTDRDDFLTSLSIDGQGNILLAYETQADNLPVESTFLKVDRLGEVLWKRTIAKDSTNVSVRSVTWLDDGSAVGAGLVTEDAGQGTRRRYSDFYIVKLDDSGTILWEKSYGGIDNDYVQAMRKTSDGGFILIGDTQSFSFDRNYDIYAVKLDGNGDMLWDKVIGDHRTNGSQNIIETSSGDYLFVGESVTGNVQAFDVIAGRLTADGELSWVRHNGGDGADAGFAVAELPGGNFAITGYSNSMGAGQPYNVLLMIIDHEGRELERRYYGGSQTDIGYDILVSHEGDILIAGMSSEEQQTDVQNFFARCSSEIHTAVGETQGEDSEKNDLFYDYASDQIILRSPLQTESAVYILDIQGRVVHQGILAARTREYPLVRSPSPGVYVVMVVSGNALLQKIFLLL